MTHVKNNPAYLGNLVDELFHQFPATWGKDIQSNFAYPPANIHETTDAYHVALSAPGRNKEDFSIQVDNNLLTISFEKKPETEQANFKTIRKEFNFRSFKRSFSLDEKIETTGIQAKYENGVLLVLLPKKEEVKVTPQKITVL
jgi:HSP20 family protein